MFKIRDFNNSFQTKLNSDIRKIKNDQKVYCPADKTSNFYRVEPEEADTLIEKEINKEYKKAEEDIVKDVIEEAKGIANKLEIDDRVLFGNGLNFGSP